MHLSISIAFASALVPAAALAQPPAPAELVPVPTPETPAETPAPAASAEKSAEKPAAPAGPKLTIGGYVEEYYQASFQDPSNRITNLRHDNRSRTFTLPNVALDVKGEKGPIATHIVLQVGHMPTTYYAGEPVSPGANGANTSTGELWKYLQAANVTAAAPGDLTIEAGLFPSPIGLEVIPIKDNWNWSRSNLFFALPSYHTGVMVSHPLGGGWSGKLHLYNGVNSIVDINVYPSTAL
jgi:hypothetical protein